MRPQQLYPTKPKVLLLARYGRQRRLRARSLQTLKTVQAVAREWFLVETTSADLARAELAKWPLELPGAGVRIKAHGTNR